MLEMLPVPFEGSDFNNPHSESVASEYGTMLLDIPDVFPKKKKDPQSTPAPAPATQ